MEASSAAPPDPPELTPVEEPDSDASVGAASEDSGETSRQLFRRRVERVRLQANSIVAVLLVAYLIALAALNTGTVKAHWVFGSTRVALVWIVLVAALLGWVLGLLSIAAFHWRTRRPRR